MTPKTFFDRLVTQLKTITQFGNNVFLVPFLPVIASLPQQVSPSCFVIEGGYDYHDEHPQIVFQNFSIVYFLENVNSSYGNSSVAGSGGKEGVVDIDALVAQKIIETATLGGDKVSIIEKGVSRSNEVRGNSPVLERQSNYHVILQSY